MVWPIMVTSFSRREFAADLIEEIEDEADLVHGSGLFCARGLQHGEALAVGVQVKVRAQPAVGELAGRPELGLVGTEGVAGSRVSHRHDLVVLCTIKKLLGVARPLGVEAASGRNLPLASWAGERPNVYFVATGFVGFISEPAAIGREGGLPFGESAVHKGLRLSGLPAGLLVAFDGEGHDVVIRAGVQLVERQHLAIGPPGSCKLKVLAFREALGIPGAIGAYPPEVISPAFFLRGIDDSLTIWSPDGIAAILTGKGQARESITFPLVHPDVEPLSVI